MPWSPHGRTKVRFLAAHAYTSERNHKIWRLWTVMALLAHLPIPPPGERLLIILKRKKFFSKGEGKGISRLLVLEHRPVSLERGRRRFYLHCPRAFWGSESLCISLEGYIISSFQGYLLFRHVFCSEGLDHAGTWEIQWEFSPNSSL